MAEETQLEKRLYLFFESYKRKLRLNSRTAQGAAAGQQAHRMTNKDEASDKKCLVSLEKFTDKRGTSSLPLACFNFINSIIGSGIIGLPYSMNQAGLPLGIVLLFVVALIADYSIILLIKGGNLSGTWSYQSLVQNTFGFIGYLILSVLQFFYNIITGDTLTKVFQRLPGVGPDHLFAERRFVIFLTTVLFTFPLSLYRDVSKLGKVSLLSMIFTLMVLSVVVIRAATLGPQIPPVENAWTFAHWNAIQAIGVMSSGFICHHNSFMIYGSLKEPTLGTWSRVTHFSVSSAALISLLFATAGYATFTGYTQGDIFENYCRSDDLATFGRFCFGICIVTTFPLECFVTREVVSNVFFRGVLSNIAHVVVTVVIIAVSTVISLTYDCLGIVLELNGVLCATPLIFVIPSACYLKLSSSRWFQGENLVCCILLLVGVCVMVIGLAMTVLYPQDCSHGAEMFYCISNDSALNATPSTTISVPEVFSVSPNETNF
ncbi:putative sodium-coupled neutral amino acid transporter 11 isoform X2 [Brienomyrus brachyistius]|uniref:putative sodium-coupled neutral amino acid transporter 11 isoform X2 n=1 Tax=Brienomyrus brachyistius TaxID=42636 RepID=UPI0020B1D2F6|nr:putative sodium-coupled neutral amino acid transporter 11 isoform X2 [Brienomyrus brachyistius]